MGREIEYDGGLYSDVINYYVTYGTQTARLIQHEKCADLKRNVQKNQKRFLGAVSRGLRMHSRGSQGVNVTRFVNHAIYHP